MREICSDNRGHLTAPKFTCTNCTGNLDVVDFSGAPAGAPLYSYSKRTYAGNFGNGPYFPLWGKVVSIKINVTKPYTGKKSSLNLEPLGQGYNTVINPDGSYGRPDPTINMKIPGERVITPSGVIGA